MYQNAAQTYRQNNVVTADPLKLVLMCYEGAIRNLKLARDSFALKDYETKGKTLGKALDIINELNSSLDLEKGGRIAVQLRSLYLYMNQALIEADFKKDVATFDRVITMLEELEVAWETIATPSRSTAFVKKQPAAATLGVPEQKPRLAGAWQTA